MKNRSLYSIAEAREMLGGISRNTIYGLLHTGDLPSVVIGCRRFVSGSAIAELIERSTTTQSPALDPRLACGRQTRIFGPFLCHQ
jgi:predicted DNA-binding transcriptional regulator AlpA